jgi:hypothetical protein
MKCVGVGALIKPSWNRAQFSFRLQRGTVVRGPEEVTAQPAAALAGRYAIGRLLLVLACGYWGPTALIWAGAIPFALRFHVLVLSAAGLAIYAAASGCSPRELGLRRDTLAGSLIANAVLLGVVSAGLIVAYASGLIRAPKVPGWVWFFPLYVLLFAPAQEVACRAVLFAELARRGVVSGAAQVLITAVTYAFIHVIYRDALVLAATFVIGVAWGAIYRRWPNLVGVSASHAGIGMSAILVGLI